MPESDKGTYKVEEKANQLPQGDFVPCSLIILGVAGGLTFVAVSPDRIGYSAASGVTAVLGTAIATVCTAVLLAYRDLCGSRARAFMCACCPARSRSRARLLSNSSPDAKRAVQMTAWATNPANPVTAPETKTAHASVQDAPVVYPKDRPTPEYLEGCARAALDLEKSLLAIDDEAWRKAVAQNIEAKYGLAWTSTQAAPSPAVVRRRSSLHMAMPATVAASARALRSLAMRYVTSVAPLARGPFIWAEGKAPLRAGGAHALNTAVASWTDTTASAADSSFFSSMGIWISPYAVTLMFTCAVVFSVMATPFTAKASWALFPGPESLHAMALWSAAMVNASTALFLRAGQRARARLCWVVGYLISAVFMVLKGVLTACDCRHTYDVVATKILVSRGESAWQLSIIDVLTGLSCLLLGAIAIFPQHSFELVFIAMPSSELAAGIVHYCLTPKSSDGFGGASLSGFGAALFYGYGTFMWLRRRRALNVAYLLSNTDARRYDLVFEQLKQQPGFRDELEVLWAAWGRAMDRATKCPRLQLSAATIGELFAQADLLNDLLQAKMYPLCVVHGGKLSQCEVKNEARALQKLHRTYRGEWRKLNDLCRTSVVFDSVLQISACLADINDDHELELVHVRDEKMRLREDFDATLSSGGYRDIQLTVMLKTDESHARGVDKHLAEVQLHLCAFANLKSQGGHRNYVVRRNLKGE